MKYIHLWGVNQNNLKGVEIKIPIGSFTVICGPSGSGKSSLAFETLYAEGQRRYTESLSNYSKQFLSKAPKPNIEGIENIPPAIAIEQKNAVKSSRSTVGTASEVLDYLRLLYEKIGQAYCPDHHIALKKDSVSEGSARIVTHFAGERGYILAPISKENRPVSAKKIYEQLLKDGIRRIYIPPKASSIKPKKTQTKASTPYYQASMGKILELENDPKLKKSGVPKEDFFVVIDRMAFSEDEMGRIADSLSQAYSASLKYNQQFKSGRALIVSTEGKHLNLSEDFSCSICSYSFPPISSRLFSFNSPIGACPKCKGFGNLLELDEKKIIPQPNLSLAQGALIPFTMPSAARDRRSLLSFCKKENIDVHSPWKDLPLQSRKLIWEGSDRFYGIKGLFDYLETKKYKMHVRVFLSRYKSPSTCDSCQGTRLRSEAHQVLIQSKSLSQLCEMTSPELHSFLKRIEFSEQQIEICKELYRQLLARLSYLEEVGIGYLTMDRSTKTLSGGEFQRLNLANQLGMGLSQTLYVLDEPTVGLHPRDNLRLINILKKLQNQGNTLVVVEHDHDVIWNASQIIEIGPGSGQFGGEVLFSGKAKDFLKFEKSNTLPYLLGQNQWKTTSPERPVSIDSYRFKIEILGCTGHNLKNVDLIIPLHRIVTVTGVSGSGKSSLVTHSLYPALVQTRENMLVQGLSYKELRGAELIKGLLMIDQSPIGKTARSNPVTYLKVYDFIRNIFANTPEAKAMGFSPGTFSLNVEGGRCPVCKGLGHELVDMMFMDDLELICEACEGKKFRPEILEVFFRGRNIHDVLNMTVSEAMDFFVSHPNIRRPLSVLREVGLDYLRLGQSANSLSGGESQRLKIARELNSANQKSTLYILDEPTTGLHFREVHLLLGVLNRLVDAGGSVLLVEHNLEIIKNSDWIIDIGPEAGHEGGNIIASGTPHEVALSNQGYTGQYLRQYLRNDPSRFSTSSEELPVSETSGDRINS